MKKILLLLVLLLTVQFVSAQCAPIYVSTTGTALGDGTEANPMDIQTALVQACVQARPDIRVLAGTYSLTSKMVIGCNNIIIDGDWEIVAGVGRKNSSLVTTINIDSPLQTAAYDGAAGTAVGFYVGVEAIARLNTRIQDITFNVKNGGASGVASGTTGNRGNSVYGFYFRNSTGWVLERCIMNTGSGSSGATGTNGAAGAPGANGAVGSVGDCDSDCITNFGGAGGAGGGGTAGAGTNNDFSCTNPGQAGTAGAASGIARNGGGGGSGGSAGAENNSGGSGNSGGAGGGGAAAGTTNGAGGGGYGSNGSGNCAVSDGRAGSSGAAGAAGTAGVALATSANYNFYWEPSAQSGTGTNGAGGGGARGGGGGGGQGCFFCIDGTGSGGGGGGGGGQGGAAGTGGWGGGGSFALYLFGSTGLRNNTTLVSGAAASGGIAGTGGIGGVGGTGGLGGGGNNNNQTAGCSTTGARLCGNAEVGAGGQGGQGGAGGNAGAGGVGATGVSSTVQLVSASTATPTTTAAITQIITNQPLESCTNSEITIGKDGGTWGITGTGSYINDLNATTSSYNNASAAAIVSYTSTGAQSVNINGTPYAGFIVVNTTRPLPTFDASMSSSICEGESFNMNTTATGVEYEWVIFPASGSTAVPTAIFTTVVASWTTPVTGIAANYTVRLRVRQTCCGWSTPVYFNFSVVGASAGPVASGVTICENGTAALTATGSGVGNITWFSDALGQNVLQSTPGVTSNFTTNILTQNTTYYVGEGTGCVGELTAVPVVVNQAPADPNATSTDVCVGQSVIMNAAGAGGTYSWFNVPSAGVALATGPSYNAGALAAGTYTYYLSESNGSCSSNRVPVSIVVNPNPVAPTVAPVTICNNTNTTLTATGTGIQWYSDAGLTNLLGIGATYTTPVLTSNTNYYATQTNANGCESPSATLVVTVSGTVTPTLSITSSSTSICAGTAVNFTANSTNGGTPTYDWFINGVSQGVNASTYNSSALVNNDVVTAQMTSSSACATPASLGSNSIVITVGSSVTPTIAISASATAICAGTSVTFSANTTFGGTAPTIQWQVNGLPVGTNNAVFTSSSLNTGDAVTAVLTSNGTCVSTTTANSNTINITVNPSVTPSLSITSSATTICAGTMVNFTATPINGGGAPIYEWYINGIAQGVNNTAFSSATLNPSDMVFARLISNAGCATPTQVTSNSVVMTVNSVVTPTVAISSSATSICEGTSVSFSASAVNGGTAPVYQWTVNGVPVGANSSAYVSSTLPNAGAVQLTLTSNAVCATTATATSNTINMTVSTNVLPSISIAATATSICAGTSVTFTATPVNGGATPTYEWFVNGIAQGVNANTFVSATLNQSDVVAARLISSATCASPSIATSNSIVISVNPIVTPTISVSASATSVCASEMVIFSAATANGGASQTIQWNVNGLPVGSNSATFTSSTLTNGDIVDATLTSLEACLTASTAASNTIAMTVNANVIPTIAVSASATEICTGTSVTYTASATNGGATPVYEWFVNGAAQLVNATTFTSATLSDGDVVNAQLLSNAACASPALVNSNSVVMTVHQISTPNITISSTQSSICVGESVTFIASANDNGFGPSIVWNLNGSPVSTNNVAYTNGSLVNGDVITAVLTSGAFCPTVASATSNSIAITVSTNVTPEIGITASANSICAGTSVTFNASTLNPGASPVYEWYINGVAQSVNAATFATSTLIQGDVVTAQLTSSSPCATVATVSSNSVVMTVGALVTPTISITSSATTICNGETITFVAAISNGGANPVIQWTVNGNPVGANSSVYTTSTLASGDVVAATLTSDANCATTTTATSNTISLTVNSNVMPLAFISTPSVIFCPGNSVTFTSNVTNGGASPTYDWYLNGVSTGVSTANYTNSTPANGDVVTLVFTSSSACASVPTVTSNSVTLFSSTSAVASVSASSLTGSLCEGDLINFVAIPVNASGTLSYQWQVNGASVGLNNNVFSTNSLGAGDIVTIVLSYQDACGNNLTATSNALIVFAKPIVSAGPDATIVNGIPVVLNGSASIPGSILWSPAGTLSSAVILNPTANPTNTTDYLLTVQTVDGCVGTDMVTISVSDSTFGIFNSFTPNGDGINDTWVIPNASAYPEISVQIFNRWGNLLYEQENTYVPWDGTHDGAKLPSDTYFYIVILTPDADALKGPVTIVR